MVDALRLTAPAKLNLHLHITGKRPDGYHLLESLVAFCDVEDIIEIALSDKLELDITGPFAADIAQDNTENSVLAMARALQAHTGVTLGAHITLHKYIPTGAGLGGGSADAAAILQGLQQFWEVAISREAQHKIALAVGADVPACLYGQSLWMTEVGDMLAPITIPACYAVLVNPCKPLSTAKVYAAFTGKFRTVQSPPTLGGLAAWYAWMRTQHNDLHDAAVRCMPEIATILQALAKIPHCQASRMTGSGSTCFGVFEQELQASAAVAQLQKIFPNYWIQITRIKGV